MDDNTKQNKTTESPLKTLANGLKIFASMAESISFIRQDIAKIAASQKIKPSAKATSFFEKSLTPKLIKKTETTKATKVNSKGKSGTKTDDKSGSILGGLGGIASSLTSFIPGGLIISVMTTLLSALFKIVLAAGIIGQFLKSPGIREKAAVFVGDLMVNFFNGVASIFNVVKVVLENPSVKKSVEKAINSIISTIGEVLGSFLKTTITTLKTPFGPLNVTLGEAIAIVVASFATFKLALIALVASRKAVPIPDLEPDLDDKKGGRGPGKGPGPAPGQGPGKEVTRPAPGPGKEVTRPAPSPKQIKIKPLTPGAIGTMVGFAVIEEVTNLFGREKEEIIKKYDDVLEKFGLKFVRNQQGTATSYEIDGKKYDKFQDLPFEYRNLIDALGHQGSKSTIDAQKHIQENPELYGLLTTEEGRKNRKKSQYEMDVAERERLSAEKAAAQAQGKPTPMQPEATQAEPQNTQAEPQKVEVAARKLPPKTPTPAPAPVPQPATIKPVDKSKALAQSEYEPKRTEAPGIERPSNVTLGEKADVSRVNMELLRRVYSAAAEYGKPVSINSGYRDDAYQAQLWVRGNILKEPGIFIPSLPQTTQTIMYKGKEYTVQGSGRGSPHFLNGELDISPGVDNAEWRSILQKHGVVFPYGLKDPPHVALGPGIAATQVASKNVAPATDSKPAQVTQVAAAQSRTGETVASVGSAFQDVMRRVIKPNIIVDVPMTTTTTQLVSNPTQNQKQSGTGEESEYMKLLVGRTVTI